MKKISLLAAIAIATIFSSSAFAAPEAITDNEKTSEIINECYPGLKAYYETGLLKDVSICRYVDKATGNILTNVAYNRTAPRHAPAPRFENRFRHGRQ